MLSWIEKKTQGRQDGPFISQAGLVGLLLLASPRRSRAASGPPPPETGGERWEAGKEWARNGRNKKDQKSICIQYFNICYILYIYIYIHIIVYTYIYIYICLYKTYIYIIKCVYIHIFGEIRYLTCYVQSLVWLVVCGSNLLCIFECVYMYDPCKFIWNVDFLTDVDFHCFLFTTLACCLPFEGWAMAMLPRRLLRKEFWFAEQMASPTCISPFHPCLHTCQRRLFLWQGRLNARKLLEKRCPKLKKMPDTGIGWYSRHPADHGWWWVSRHIKTHLGLGDPALSRRMRLWKSSMGTQHLGQGTVKDV